MAITDGAFPAATDSEASPMTTNSGDSSPQWGGGFGACDCPKISPGGDNSARNWHSQNTSDVDVIQQLLCKSAGGDSVAGVPVPDAPLPEARSDGLVGE